MALKPSSHICVDTTPIHTHLQDDLQDDFQDPHTQRKKRMTGKKRVVGGSRGSHQTARWEVTPWRDQTTDGGKPTTNPEKKAAAQHPKTPMRIYILLGTHKPIPETPKQKKYIQKETEKENRGNTTPPHTKKKERMRGEKHDMGRNRHPGPRLHQPGREPILETPRRKHPESPRRTPRKPT